MKFFRRNSSNKPQRKKVTDNPSVLDFPTIDSLKNALQGKRATIKSKPDNKNSSKSSTRSMSRSSRGVQTSEQTFEADDSSIRSMKSTSSSSMIKEVDVEWEIKNYDKEETEALTMEQELHRLQVLQSYLLLDSDTEEEFERLTSLVSKVFNVPIAVISLVDLGRQWFMSIQGLDAKETPRKHAFCAHVIMNIKNIMVVPDASKDVRFQDNPLVTGPPNIRFYAGAALVSPEGYKLGTVCIIDSKPRFLKKAEQQILKDFAAMAMTAMVDRRDRLQNQQASQAKLLAHTCLDLAQSLETVQLALAELSKEAAPVLTDAQRGTLAVATSQVELKVRTCRSALRTCTATKNEGLNVPKVPPPSDASVSSYDRMGSGYMSASLSNLFEDFEKISGVADTAAVTKMTELYENLNSIIAPLPNRVPITIELQDTVPSKIIADDLLLFRSGLNLLSSSMDRTKPSDDGIDFIRLTIRAEDDQIFFECEDTGPVIPPEDCKNYFIKSHDHLLTPMVSMVSSMGGDYGINNNDNDETKTTTTIWFAIPLMAAVDMTDWSCENKAVGANMIQNHEPKVGRAGLNGNKTQVLLGDPFQAALIADSCLSSALEPTLRNMGEARMAI